MEDTTQRLQEAIAAARSGQLAEARGIAEELTEENPQNAHAWFLRSILAQDEGEQLEYLNKTLEIDPEHKAARKRVEQMQPALEEEAEAEVEEAFEEELEAEAEEELEAEAEELAEMEAEQELEIDEEAELEVEEMDESEEDMTMIVESAAFMAAVSTGDADDDLIEEVITETPPREAFEEAAEPTFEDTMIAESPFAEEMAAEDIEVDALFADVDSMEEEPEPADDYEDMATIIAAAAVLGQEEEAADEFDEAVDEMEEGELQAADLAAAAAGATVLDQASEAWFEEEAGDELWAKVEAEAVPDWLIEDTATEADESLAGESLDETFSAAEVEPTREHDLPDWLLEEPDDDWSEAAEAVDDTQIYEEAPATVVTAAVATDEMLEDEEEEPSEVEPVEEAAPPKPKKKSPNRAIEIILILLVIVAVAIVGALVYFLISPPAF